MKWGIRMTDRCGRNILVGCVYSIETALRVAAPLEMALRPDYRVHLSVEGGFKVAEKGESRFVRSNVLLRKDQKEWLEEVEKRTGHSYSAIVRMALDLLKHTKNVPLEGA